MPVLGMKGAAVSLRGPTKDENIFSVCFYSPSLENK